MSPEGTFDRAPLNATVQLKSLDSDNLLSEYRDLVFYRLAILALIGIGPFVVSALADGAYVVGGVGVVIMIALAVDVWALRSRRTAPVPYALLFLPMMANIIALLLTRGVFVAFWAYPLLLMVHFALEDRRANLMNGIFTAVMVGVAASRYDTEIVVRLAATMALTIGAANVFSRLASQLQRRLQTMAIIDPLTGAYNRRYLYLCLSDALARRDRSGADTSVLLLDLDHFKKVNDDFGHTTGDRVLVSLVQTLRQSLRRVDSVFRLGGEEFAVLLTDTNEDEARVVGEKLRKIIEDSALLERRPITISVGCASIGKHADPVQWVQSCDEALYAAKARGRNCLVLASEMLVASKPTPQPAL